ncbi:MAG: flagellar motor protein MotB [Planctomycetota bacterium]|jgi:hypothetical protein
MPFESGPEETKRGAPRYLVAYCSIMTLLLAFFIILQAFAPEQSEGLFQAGQGSFVRAIRTFGLGGIFERMGSRRLEGRGGPRYRAPEGQETPPRLRRIDPELEDAQMALEALEDQFDVQEPREATGYRVELSTPCTYGPDKDRLTPQEEQFIEALAPRLQRVLLARGFVIRVGAALRPGPGDPLAQTTAALDAAARVRESLIAAMDPRVHEMARARTYTFCRREAAPSASPEAESGQLTIDILLTKPYAQALREEGVDQSGENSTS